MKFVVLGYELAKLFTVKLRSSRVVLLLGISCRAVMLTEESLLENLNENQ